jgi:Amt family ammonium transporter
MMKKLLLTLAAMAAVAGLAAPVYAQEVTAEVAVVADPVGYAIDNLFLFIGAVLVIFMQPGFAMVECGFNSAKNAVNILFKNVMDLCVGALLFFIFGYGMMYPGDAWIIPNVFGFGHFGIGGIGNEVLAGKLTPQCDFLFQVAFAATAATIVSGSVAGRLKFHAYLIYSAIITGLVYPISGSWQWGCGWLYQMGFHDFAGSIVVHAVGGFAGLAGAIMLGPRIGRFAPDGKPKAIPGHNLPLAALGVFILWVGWYGFNPASKLAIVGGDNTNAVMLIAVNTTLAAAVGGIVSMITVWILHKKPDLTMALNGILAGLVGITANCDCVTNEAAICIGAVAGLIVVAGVKLLDALKIDDPVGAFPVHGMCGVWGGLACGIFGGQPMVAQIIGSLVIPLWSFGCMLVLFGVLKAVKMLRVSPEEEIRGLDLGEHGEEAYSGFQLWTTQ